MPVRSFMINSRKGTNSMQWLFWRVAAKILVKKANWLPVMNDKDNAAANGHQIFF